MKVNFFIAGTQKAGTTSLDAYLRQHPQILMARRKELRFFDQDNLEPNFAAYEASFDDKPGAVVKGEATPSYMYWPGAAERISAYNGDAKVVALLRNPIARAFSQWRMEVERGGEQTDFSSAIRTEQGRLAVLDSRGRKRRSYVDRGRYARQIERLRSIFPASNLLFIKTEIFSQDGATTVTKVLDFLHVEPAALDTAARFKVGHYDGDMPAEDRDYLREQFFADTRFVEHSFGWDCSDWQ